MKILKKLVAGVISVGMLASMSAFSAAALFDDDDTDSVSTTDSVLSSTTFNATVERVSTAALMVVPDTSANLGSSLGVVCSNASSFSVGDIVTITYSSEVSEDNGMRSITADSVTLVTANATSASVNLLDDEDDSSANNTPAETTSKPADSVSTSSATPATGDAGVAGFAMTAVLCGTACVAISLYKRKEA